MDASAVPQSLKDLNRNKYLFILSHLELKDVLALAMKRLASVNHYYVVKRSLRSLPDPKAPRNPITLNKISDGDIHEIMRSIGDLDGESKKEVISRLLFYSAGFENCYVARTRDDEIAFLQWLIRPSENEVIEKDFFRIFNPLEHGQVMIENAFTFPKFRGFGLFPVVSRELMTIARDEGYTSAVAYIRKDKIISLNEFIRMGFRITKLIREFKIIGITTRAL